MIEEIRMSARPVVTRVETPHSPAACEERVRQTLRQVNALCKGTTLRFALDVGRLVVEGLYDGDLRRLRSRGQKDELAMRRLAADPDLAMSASALYRCVAIFELCGRLHRTEWRHVSTSHLRLVLPLPPSEQERFVREAEANGWKVRELERHIASFVGVAPPACAKGGRRRRSELSSVVHTLEKGTERVIGLLATCEGDTAKPSPESVRATVLALERLRKACDALEQRVTRALRRSDGGARHAAAYEGPTP